MYSGFGRHLLLNQDHLLPWVQFITVQYPDGAMVVVYECLHGPRFELCRSLCLWRGFFRAHNLESAMRFCPCAEVLFQIKRLARDYYFGLPIRFLFKIDRVCPGVRDGDPTIRSIVAEDTKSGLAISDCNRYNQACRFYIPAWRKQLR